MSENTSVCTNCGATKVEGQSFCPSCGAASAAVPSTCGGCGTPLAEGQTFCPSCGQKAGHSVEPVTANAIGQYNATVAAKNPKKNLIAIGLVAALVVAGVAGFFIFQDSNKKAVAAQYVTNAKEILSEMTTSGNTMEDIGNKIQANWNTYVYNNGYYIKTFDTVDDAIAAAQVDQSANINTVESDRTTIDALYKKLTDAPEGASSEITKIHSAVEDAYSAYTDMYGTVMEPAGNYTSWTADFGRVDTALASELKTLRELAE